MSTDRVKIALTWNLVFNSNCVENLSKLQLQKLFQIISSPFTIFLGIFLPPYLFSPLLIQFLVI
jgi:hypothetical protein